MTVWAIDLGNDQTKLMSDKKYYRYPSALLPQSNNGVVWSGETDSSLDKFELQGSDRVFYWGNGILSKPETDLRKTIGFADRYSQAAFRNLCEFSLGKLASDYPEAKDKAMPVSIVLGLPTGDFNKKKVQEQIKNNFTAHKEHLIIVNGESFMVRIEHCYLIPQPIGTLYDLMYDKQLDLQEDLSQKQVTICDIGGGTVLLDQVNQFQMDNVNRMQLDKGGVSHLLDLISNDIQQELEFTPDKHKLGESIREKLPTKRIDYRRSESNDDDITEIVKRNIEEYTEQISNDIYSTFQSIDTIDRLVITGGGANLIDRDKLRADFKTLKVVFPENTENANVRGFYKFGLRYTQKSNEK